MSAQRIERSQRGFSLVELMISIVIGMLALVFATRLMTSAERNRQAALGGSESMQNGMQALFAINKDAAQAGWGLNDPLVAGCDTVLHDTGGFALATAKRGTDDVTPLAAALIESNNGGPDRLSLYAGSSITGTGAVGLSADYAGSGATLQVDRIPFGFTTGDAIVVVPESGGQCAIAQIAAIPTPEDNVQLFSIAANEGNRFNGADGLGVTYKAGAARVMNLGPAATLSLHTWSVENNFLLLRATDMAGTAATGKAVIGNIVSLKAQYGFDTRGSFDPEQGMQVKEWSPAMIDADGDGVVGNAGDHQRIAALRIAIIARSKEPERPGSDGSCHASPDSTMTVFATEEPKGVDAVPMTAVLGPGADAKCYRYRVFESIVPLRNLAWRPTAQ